MAFCQAFRNLVCLNKFFGKKQVCEQKETTTQNKEYNTFLFLIYMYFLQAIPFGFDQSLPLIFSGKSVPYDWQGTFTLAQLPYSLKLLW
jgi:hypothetical protein